MTTNKIISITLGVLVVGLATVLVVTQPRAGQYKSLVSPGVSPGTVVSSKPTMSAPTAPPSGYTLKQVAAHNSAQSCWSAVNSIVYDLTSWIAQHPGGAGAILSICGIDDSGAFNAQHGGQNRPERILAAYRIGVLAQ